MPQDVVGLKCLSVIMVIMFTIIEFYCFSVFYVDNECVVPHQSCAVSHSFVLSYLSCLVSCYVQIMNLNGKDRVENPNSIILFHFLTFHFTFGN